MLLSLGILFFVIITYPNTPMAGGDRSIGEKSISQHPDTSKDQKEEVSQEVIDPKATSISSREAFFDDIITISGRGFKSFEKIVVKVGGICEREPALEVTDSQISFRLRETGGPCVTRELMFLEPGEKSVSVYGYGPATSTRKLLGTFSLLVKVRK